MHRASPRTALQCYYWKCCSQMKASQLWRGYFGVLPKPQASTGLCSYVWSLRGDILRNADALSPSWWQNHLTLQNGFLCGNCETVYMATQYLVLVLWWGFYMCVVEKQSYSHNLLINAKMAIMFDDTQIRRANDAMQSEEIYQLQASFSHF